MQIAEGKLLAKPGSECVCSIAASSLKPLGNWHSQVSPPSESTAMLDLIQCFRYKRQGRRM